MAHVKHASETPTPSPSPNLVGLTAQIVAAYVSANQVPRDDVGGLIARVHSGLHSCANGLAGDDKKPAAPAVPIKKSHGDDFLICLHDGKRLTMLKRYLRTRYNQSPEEYRKAFGLPPDYPMVAPAYARLRSQFAKKIGLGRVPTRGRRK